MGVNDFVQEDEPPPETLLHIDESAAETQLARLVALRKTRDNIAVAARSTRCAAAAGATANVDAPDCSSPFRAYATVGEMCDALREVWGEWGRLPSI